MLTRPDHNIPEELKLLHFFDRQVDDFYLDIEFLDNYDFHLNNLANGYVNQFIPLAIDGTGSLMVFWLQNKETPINRAPIAYLDSEGGGTIAAKSLQEFLSLLPYDTSLFSEVGMHWTEYKLNPEITVSPYEKYTKDYYNSRYEFLFNTYPCYKDFRIWLEEEIKIQPEKNPASVIMENIDSYPSFPIKY